MLNRGRMVFAGRIWSQAGSISLDRAPPEKRLKTYAEILDFVNWKKKKLGL